MVASIGGLGTHIDSEYLWIIQELRRFGLSPSGNKAADLGRLEQAKAELVRKIQQREVDEARQELKTEIISPVDEPEYAERSDLEAQRTGAMNIAMLNKLYFGL